MSKKLHFDNNVHYSVPFVFELTSLKENVGTETLTVNSGYKLVKETRAGGFNEEQTAYILSGSIPINKAKSIATLKIEAINDYYFGSSPFIETSFNNNIKLSLKSVNKIKRTNKWEKTKSINAYTFDIIYQNNLATSRSNGLIAKLKYSSIETYIRTSIIDKISHGFTDNIVPTSGGTRPIKIFGQPGSTFAVAVNENTLDVELKEDGSTPTGRVIFDKTNSVSIISSFNANSTSVFNGKTISVVKDTIDASGVYSFNQTYPSIPLSTSILTTVSSSHTIKVADSVDNEMLRPFTIDPASGDGTDTGRPIIKLTEYTATGFSAGDDHTFSAFGQVGIPKLVPVQIKLKLLAAGGNAFTTTRNPIFSNLISQSSGIGVKVATPALAQSDGGSDWSNSTFLDNGGTVIIGTKGNIALSTASVTNDTCELDFSFFIRRFGTKDVELELDLDKVLTVS